MGTHQLDVRLKDILKDGRDTFLTVCVRQNKRSTICLLQTKHTEISKKF